MEYENKVVNLEMVTNEKVELAGQLKKEMEASATFRLNNILKHVVDHEVCLREYGRRLDKQEALMKNLVDYMLEK